jgi:hypothetical protein
MVDMEETLQTSRAGGHDASGDVTRKPQKKLINNAYEPKVPDFG